MNATPVTLALGLRSTAQGLGIVGRELGVFARHGLDLRIVREETAGPAGARGLVQGEYQFAEFGSVPVVQAAQQGQGLVILMAAEQVAALYLLGRRGVARGDVARVGVLSEAGQTGHSARQVLARWDRHPVELVPLGTYPKVYAALAAGEIDAGVLTADYRLAGEVAHGFHELADLGQELGYQGPVLATTRALARSQPDLVQRVVAAYVETIRVFKSSPAEVARVLQRHLGFVDAQQAAAIQRFYAARFQDRPYASEQGIARVIASLGAASIQVSDVLDASFLKASERN